MTLLKFMIPALLLFPLLRSTHMEGCCLDPSIISTSCQNLLELTARRNLLHLLWGKLRPGSVSFEQLVGRHNIEPLDGILVSAWISIYLEAQESTRSERLAELKRLSLTQSYHILLELFRRLDDEFSHRLEDLEKQVRHEFEAEIASLQQQVDEAEADIESLQMEEAARQSVFQDHVAKFKGVNKEFRRTGRNASNSQRSPDYKPFHGFDGNRAHMFHLARLMDAERDPSALAQLENEILTLLKDLKTAGLEPNGIWRICEHANKSFVDKSEERLKLKSLAQEIKDRRSRLESLKARIAFIQELISE